VSAHDEHINVTTITCPIKHCHPVQERASTPHTHAYVNTFAKIQATLTSSRYCST